MSGEEIYVSEKRRELKQASRALNTKSRYSSVQQKYLTFLKRCGHPVESVNESTPEIISDFLSEETNDFNLRASSTEFKIKALKACYNDRRENPIAGRWSVHKDPATGRTTSIQGNPADAKVVSDLTKNHKKKQARAGISEAKADPLRYKHLTAIFDACIGIPPRDAKGDFSKLRRIKAWAICTVSCNLLLRFNELVALRMEWTEFSQNDLRTVRLHLPGGTKTQHERTLCALNEWPSVCDPRTSPLCALARWLRIRGGKPGFLFCDLDGDGKLKLDKQSKESSVKDDVRGMLANVGVTDVNHISTHSMRRSGAQHYHKIGMSLNWIMKKGGWSKYEHFERYLEYSNRKTEQTLEMPLATAMHFSSQREKQQDLILHNIANVLSKPWDGKPAAQLRDAILLSIQSAAKQNIAEQ